MTRLAAASAAAAALPAPSSPAATLPPLEVVEANGGRPADSIVERVGEGVRVRLYGCPPSPSTLAPPLARSLGTLFGAAWRARLECAWLADSLASCGLDRSAGGAAIAASAAAAARARPAGAILAASPHTLEAGEEEEGGEGGGGGPLSAAPPSFASRQRLWTCAMVAAPGLGASAGAPCAPPRLARLPYYGSGGGGGARSVDEGAPPPPAPSRPDLTLTAFIDRCWGPGRGGGPDTCDAPPPPTSRPPTPSLLPPPHAPVCGSPGCCAGPGEHAFTWWHGSGRATLTVAHLPATEGLGGEGGWWVWRVPPAAGADSATAAGGGARVARVPLSPDAAALSLAHALDLAFNTPALAPSPAIGPPLRAWDLCLGRGRDVARLAWRPAPLPHLVLPGGRVAPRPAARAAWLRGEAARLARDADAVVGGVGSALEARLLAEAAPAPVAASLRAALGRARAGLAAAVEAAAAAADPPAGGGAAGDAPVAAVAALGAARRACAKLAATWAAHLWDGELWSASEAGQAAVRAAEQAAERAAAAPAPAAAAAPPPARAGGGFAVARLLFRGRRLAAGLRSWPVEEGAAAALGPPPALEACLEAEEGGWAAAVVSPGAGAAAQAAAAAAVAAALASGDRPLALALASLAARLADPPSAAALARLRDPPPGAPAGPGVLALPPAPPPTKAAAPHLRLGGRALLPVHAPDDDAPPLPLTVRDEDPATAVAYALASPAHAAFAWSGAGAGLVAQTLAAAVSGGGSDGTTTPPAADPALAHFDSTFTDEAPGPDAGRAEVRVRAWFAPHFARVRAQVGLGAPAFSATLSRSVPWAPTGGSKSGAAFAMSGDGSLLLKSLSKAEVRSFEGLAPIYFRAVLGGEAAAASPPSALVRVLGLFSVTTRPLGGGGGGGDTDGGPSSPVIVEAPLAAAAGGGGEEEEGTRRAPPPPPPLPPPTSGTGLAPRPGETIDFLVMENVFRLAAAGSGEAAGEPLTVFDLKGAASAARAAADHPGSNSSALPPAHPVQPSPPFLTARTTLLDRDLLARTAAGHPLTLPAADAAVLAAALSSDAAALGGGGGRGVMDYSLLAALMPADEDGGGRPTLAVGIVDWLRPYSLARRVERWAKAAVLSGGGGGGPAGGGGLAAGPAVMHDSDAEGGGAADPGAPDPAAAAPPPPQGTVQAPQRYAARFAGVVPGYFAAVPAGDGGDPPPAQGG